MTCIHFDPKHTPARHTPSGKGLENQDYHDLIDKLADKVEKKVIAWRHDMHQNPEPRTLNLLTFIHLPIININSINFYPVTRNSFDAFTVGVTITWEEAYKFALGEEIKSQFSSA